MTIYLKEKLQPLVFVLVADVSNKELLLLSISARYPSHGPKIYFHGAAVYPEIFSDFISRAARQIYIS